MSEIRDEFVELREWLFHKMRIPSYQMLHLIHIDKAIEKLETIRKYRSLIAGCCANTMIDEHYKDLLKALYEEEDK